MYVQKRKAVSILFFALYAQSCSIGQSKHRVAAPASCGLACLRKWRSEPKEDTLEGLVWLSQWHRISMSLNEIHIVKILQNTEKRTYWQLLVISEKQLSSSLAQFPLT